MSREWGLRGARSATAAAFLAQGLVFISLTTRLPLIQRRWGLEELALSLVLLGLVLVSGLGSFVAERLSTSRPSASVLRGGLLLIAVAVPVLALAPDFGVFAAATTAYGAGVGIVDATSNMQAVAVEHRYQRPILPSFHGAWTVGGIIGAALTLLTSHVGLLALVAVAVVPLVAAFGPFLPRAEVVDPDAVDVPWRPLLLVGAGLVLFYMVDTAATAWGPTYLGRTLGSPEALVALATFPYLLASGLLRLAGDRLVARYGVAPVLRLGALVSAGSLGLIVLAGSWQLAVLGFTLLGAGAAVIAPLSFSAAARIAGGSDLGAADRTRRVDAVIARFNQFNYVGALLGAVLTGVVGAGSLRYGFALPMVLILLMVPLAGAFAGWDRPVGAATGRAP